MRPARGYVAVVVVAGLVAAAPVVAAPSQAAVSKGAHHVRVPAAGRAVDTSKPTRWVGNGTPTSCTSKAVVRAVRKGGIIRFRCGPDPVAITMKATAKVVNTSKQVVLDGRGKVTLSGAGERRILYMNTCDPKQTWTTSHCNDQAAPRLVVQNLRLVHGDSTGRTYDGGGGGAIFVRGGRLKIVNSTFVGNRCDRHGADLGGAAVRVLDQFHDLPVYVTHTTFKAGVCSNGGALSSIGVSWQIYNSVFTDNKAVGHGANPARAGTGGGGSGGAIYNDGNTFLLHLAGSTITDNHANEGGGAIFYVSNDRSGTLAIDWSTLRRNPSDGFENAPGIYFLGKKRTFSHSIVH
jgi:Chlamydia polymorphic membrane protein (Chlamydia_PMP) repeat